MPGWSYNTSRDLCAYIHPENNTSILSPTGICSLPPYLLIIICSAVANQEARIAIRSTWANKYNLDNLYNSTVKIAFLLGKSDNDTLNVSILYGVIIIIALLHRKLLLQHIPKFITFFLELDR